MVINKQLNSLIRMLIPSITYVDDSITEGNPSQDIGEKFSIEVEYCNSKEIPVQLNWETNFTFSFSVSL